MSEYVPLLTRCSSIERMRLELLKASKGEFPIYWEVRRGRLLQIDEDAGYVRHKDRSILYLEITEPTVFRLHLFDQMQGFLAGGCAPDPDNPMHMRLLDVTDDTVWELEGADDPAEHGELPEMHEILVAVSADAPARKARVKIPQEVRDSEEILAFLVTTYGDAYTVPCAPPGKASPAKITARNALVKSDNNPTGMNFSNFNRGWSRLTGTKKISF